ncbi:MAG TPA: hypothetical protein VMV13_02855 [Candidatus Binataceae bacterium]|nr:hypothetical protein [Candidatus Binataceae bacterium]
MRKSALGGAMLATAVALMFTGSAMAADSPGSATAPAQVKCIGGNSCKGQSSCKSASNGCQGQNSCKGKGYVMTSNAKQCAKQGGHAEKEN